MLTPSNQYLQAVEEINDYVNQASDLKLNMIKYVYICEDTWA